MSSTFRRERLELTDTTVFEFHCSMGSVITLRHYNGSKTWSKEPKMRVVKSSQAVIPANDYLPVVEIGDLK